MAAQPEYLSSRGRWTRDMEDFSLDLSAKLVANPYDEEKNPQGIINLGCVDNTLPEDILLEKLREPAMNEIEPYTLYYTEYRGTQQFREAVAEFMTERFKSRDPIDPNNLICTSGICAGFDRLAHVLADPGDCFITPAPYYYGVRTDMGSRSQVELVPAHLTSKVMPDYGTSAPWELFIAAIETAYEMAIKNRKKVKGIVLVNPNNPTGDVYSPQAVRTVLEFASQRRLHVIMDEVYALSVYGEGATFTSVLAMSDLPDPLRTHVLWGFSKDFCLSGFRVGVIHSWNSHVLRALLPLCYFGMIPGMIQHKLILLMKDKEWLDKVFFPTNLARLRDSFEFCKQKLEPLGVTVHPSKAGLYIWIDLSKFISPLSKDGEMRLYELFLNAGVCVYPGAFFCGQEPGWFRVVFSHKRDILTKGLDRISSVLKSLEMP